MNSQEKEVVATIIKEVDDFVHTIQEYLEFIELKMNRLRELIA